MESCPVWAAGAARGNQMMILGERLNLIRINKSWNKDKRK